MRFVVTGLLLFAAFFSLTPFAPAEEKKGWLLWPFAADSKPFLGFLRGSLTALPSRGGLFTPVLAGTAGLSLVLALLCLSGWLVPESWWWPLVVLGAITSILLYLLYFGAFAVLPILISAVLLWGMLTQPWSVAALRGT